MEHQPYINKFDLGGVTVREDDQDYKIISSAERGDAMPRQTVNVIRRRLCPWRRLSPYAIIPSLSRRDLISSIVLRLR